MCLDLNLIFLYNRSLDRKAYIQMSQQIIKETCDYFITDLNSRSTAQEHSFVNIEKFMLKNASDDDLILLSKTYCELFEKEEAIFLKELKGEYTIFKKIETPTSIEALIKKMFSTIQNHSCTLPHSSSLSLKLQVLKGRFRA